MNAPQNPAAPFDRALWCARRDRAAQSAEDAEFLRDETVERLCDRIGDVNRCFRRAAVIGAGPGGMARALIDRFDVESVIQLDAAPTMAARARLTAPDAPALVADEEALPLAPGYFDLIVAPLTLHWVNDLPGTLIQICCALRPDGLMLAAMLAGRSLTELRECLVDAEVEMTGGLSPRVAPMADLRDLGGLLQRAGFALPVADRETVTVSYETPLRLLKDLQAMGETNVMAERHKAPLRRDVLMRAMGLYSERFADAEGRVPASFDLAFLHGWAPAPSQPQPLRPGSAKMRLAEALGAEERPAGEKAGR